MASQSLCVKALDAHADQLSKLANVVGLGVVDDGNKDCAVAVYVSKKLPLNQLNQNDVIPSKLSVTNKGRKHTVPIDVIEQGVVSLEPLLTPGAS